MEQQKIACDLAASARLNATKAARSAASDSRDEFRTWLCGSARVAPRRLHAAVRDKSLRVEERRVAGKPTSCDVTLMDHKGSS